MKESARPASFAELTERIHAAARISPLVSVTTIGLSVEGRELWMVRLNPRDGETAATPPAFIHARQHGNEPAGQDALLEMIEAVAHGTEAVPYPVLAIPCVNPDGAEKNDRRNANRMDLNRDHLLLSQPETRALHRAFREARPRLAIDCHEFGRDSSDYTAQGWSEWPLIMLDCANFPHPSLDGIYQRSVALIASISQTMTAEGFNTCRYIVGDAPPTGEIRFSTLEADDGRNSLGLYGVPSYIIESGVYRNVADSNFDLPMRVAAYRRLIRLLIEEAASQPMVPVQSGLSEEERLLPTNNFWGTTRIRTGLTLPVVDLATSKTIQVAAPRIMDERIIKNIVPMPEAYVIVKRQTVDQYRELLVSHGIPFEVTTGPVSLKTVRYRLVQIEREADAVYERFGGRQIVAALTPATELIPEGSLIVRVEGAHGLRAAVVLDPRMLYGLYQHRDYQVDLEEEGVVPVRLVLGTGEQ
jgi:hypothetical protein